ncbi:hypothetical protein P7C73_g4561, partial [Tremellales sp. Uapishka_1]
MLTPLQSKPTKARETTMIAEFKEITGATTADATRLIKKHKNVETAIDAFFADSAAQANAASTSGGKDRRNKLGAIWDKYKDPSKALITIEGTMAFCTELDIDPSSDSVLFCLATDLGSKAIGEWEREPWITGWTAMGPSIESLADMKAQLPALRTKLNSDPAYFKKVYMHTFDLSKADGARTLMLDTGIDMWKLYIPPALAARPSALSKVSSPGAPPDFTEKELGMWLEFIQKKGKAISKDTWSLFIDFVRSIDSDFKEYDEEAAWPSTIDDFVEYARKEKAT